MNENTGAHQTALMEAAINGHTETVQFLVNEGADQEARNNDGEARLKSNPHFSGRIPTHFIYH